jgi:tetratricopeptide (TPR) repeat protein
LRAGLELLSQPPEKAEAMLPERSGSPRAQALIDLEGLIQAEEMFRKAPVSRPGKRLAMLSNLLNIKAKLLEYVDDLYGALDAYDEMIEIFDRMEADLDPPMRRRKQAIALSDKAILYYFLEQYRRVIPSYH